MLLPEATMATRASPAIADAPAMAAMTLLQQACQGGRHSVVYAAAESPRPQEQGPASHPFQPPRPYTCLVLPPHSRLLRSCTPCSKRPLPAIGTLMPLRSDLPALSQQASQIVRHCRAPLLPLRFLWPKITCGEYFREVPPARRRPRARRVELRRLRVESHQRLRDVRHTVPAPAQLFAAMRNRHPMTNLSVPFAR